MRKQYLNSIIALMLCSLLPSIGLAVEDQEMELQERIRQLEAKLERLEAQQPDSSSHQTQASQPAQDQAAEIEELRRQVQILAAEIEKLRSGEAENEITAKQAASIGIGPSASKVYRKKKGVSLAGYGEMLYENFAGQDQAGDPAGKTNQLDFLRAILYAGYRFNENFVFNSEIEFEHASTGKGGEASVEFAYLEYLANQHFNLRGGLLLIPMGLTNEYHEPVAFLGARRSETETRIIPTTWREGGFGVLGSAGMCSYREYLVNGMNAAGYSSSGLRGGRQKGAKAKAEDFAFVGRLDFFPAPGMFFGGSLYTGGAGQGQFSESGSNLKVQTTIGEVHGQVQARGVDLRGLYAGAKVGDAAAVNRQFVLSGAESIGEVLQGGYIQLGYNTLSQFKETIRLTPYYRFEKLNTQHQVPDGYAKNPAQDKTIHTLGVEFRPIVNIAIKSEHQWVRNQASTGVNQFNINLGYNF